MRIPALLAAACLLLAFAAQAADPPPPAAPPPPAPASAPPAATEGQGKPDAPPVKETRPPVYLSMDFTDVDLPVLVKFMSEQTKKNFIFDERVQGKITIISPRKVTLDEAYSVFLSVLQVKGFTTVEQGNTIKIILAREARQDTIPTGPSKEAPPGAEFITRLVPLQYVDTAEVVSIITPLVSKDGMVSAIPSSNTLLLIDSRSNIDRVMKILAEVDVEGTAGGLKVFPLSYANATEAARTLESLYQETPGGQPGARPRARRFSRPRGVPVKFLPEVRTNSLIVLASAEILSDVADLLSKIDVPATTGGGKISVYYLENADAEEVAKVLASLSEKRPGQPAGATPAQQPMAAQARDAQATVKSVLSAELEGGIKVTPDKATNSLVIIASPNDYVTLVEVIKKLDIRRRQVFVEAVIMEISLDKARDIGVEYRGTAGRGDSAAITGTNFDFQGNVNTLLGSIATGNPLIFPGTGLIAGGIAGSVTLPDGTKVPALTAVLRAAQTLTNVNILSSPNLLTLDNKEAEIIVGENVPFITSQSRDSTNLANVINTIERKDVGITLRITPHIHESEYVSLDIYQESSALKDTSLLANSTVGPTTTKRSAKTSVLVKNGDMVILGGMIQETATDIERKVPLLGDIPLIGYLFKFKSVSRKKTNLLIMLTPHVIKESKELAKPSAEQRKGIDDFVAEGRRNLDRTFTPPAGKGKP